MSNLMIDGPPPVQPPVHALVGSLTAKQTEQMSAKHYGWCAYGNIELMGPNGLERHVAYAADGSFATSLERGQLLMFENVEVKEVDPKDNNIPNGPAAHLIAVQKYAIACIGEIADAYGEWGFVILPLTGTPAREAFRIFSVVQPHLYDLADLEEELINGAKKRIAAAVAEEEDFAVAKAEEVRRIMLIGARRAILFAQNIVNDLKKEQATFLGTKQGKSSATPGDEHAFRQLHEPVPSLLSTKAQGPDVMQQLLQLLAEKELRGQERSPQEEALAAALEAIKRQEERHAQQMEEMRNEISALRSAGTEPNPAELNATPPAQAGGRGARVRGS